jgi:hypothetical protein
VAAGASPEMDAVADRFRPDGSLSRTAMESMQRDIAETATFEDAVEFEPADIRSGARLVAGVVELLFVVVVVFVSLELAPTL